MIIDFIIEDLMLNSYLQKNFHTLHEDKFICCPVSDKQFGLIHLLSGWFRIF